MSFTVLKNSFRFCLVPIAGCGGSSAPDNPPGQPPTAGTALILSGLVLHQWGGAVYALVRRSLMRSSA